MRPTLNHNLEHLEMSGIRLFTAQASSYANVIKLTIGESTFATPEPIKKALVTALEYIIYTTRKESDE